MSNAEFVLVVNKEPDPETGQYPAHCNELGVATCGNSFHNALEMLLDACECYLEAVDELKPEIEDA